MKKLITTLALFITLLNSQIANYQAINKCIKIENYNYIALRSFNTNTKHYYLIVEPNNLSTYIIDSNLTKESNCTNTQTRYEILRDYNNPSHPLQNDGITHAKNGIYLTTDLCPSSKKGFEKRLYGALIKNFKNPVPVTFFIKKGGF